tara:strand:+ start:403 stop:528 length:126 start_codon:yes stop_codon:yes gene_type:complete
MVLTLEVSKPSDWSNATYCRDKRRAYTMLYEVRAGIREDGR